MLADHTKIIARIHSISYFPISWSLLSM